MRTWSLIPGGEAMRDDPEAPEPDVLEERMPAFDDEDDDDNDVAVEIPPDVPEADALEQGRQPAIPPPERPPRLPDDPEVPEADALEQAEPATFYDDEDDHHPSTEGRGDFSE
jgi:hypothetical protein